MPDQQPQGGGDRGDLLVQVFGEFREFRGAVSTRLDSVEHELRAGLELVREAVDGEAGDGEDLRRRLVQVETRQQLAYRALGAVALRSAADLAAEDDVNRSIEDAAHMRTRRRRALLEVLIDEINRSRIPSLPSLTMDDVEAAYMANLEEPS